MMENPLDEILSEHSERLRRGETINAEEFIRRAPHAANELRTLFRLAENLQRALVPVSPARAFRDQLREGLMLSARERKQSKWIQLANPRPWRYWWVGAAALGSAVAAGGIIAWVVRARQRSPLLLPVHAK